MTVPSHQQRHGVFVPHRTLIPLSLAIVVLVGLQAKTLLDGSTQRTHGLIPVTVGGGGQSTSYQGMLMQDDETASKECRWFLADSAIPNGGLGVFTAVGLHKNEMVGFPDICIFVGDAPTKWTDHLHSHTYGGGSFFGQYEGDNNRAACEGFTTIFNTAPLSMVNSELVSPVLQTNAGLHRAKSPGAGAITHHYGITARAKDVIVAGSELTVDYGDWEWDDATKFTRPIRNVTWLQDNGWCIDNVYISLSTIPDAGRGAFARRPVRKGDAVAPAPLQVFRDRKVFENTDPEQLFVNYCLQPSKSTMIFFPYGPAVGLINHASAPHTANVGWRWSTQTGSKRHDPTLLNLPPDSKKWRDVLAGMLILEVYALRDIEVGEELLLDYGSAWESAWRKHVAAWRPLPDASKYVYPMDMDETTIVRTVKEQKSEPYPDNIGFICATAHWERPKDAKNKLTWTEPTEWTWWEAMTCCHILDRKWDVKSDSYLYTVELIFDNKPEGFKFNPDKPSAERMIDTAVPRRAIRFIEIPYMDDEHMKGVFRHPLELPNELVPDAWKNVHN
jgi:hypothetical protein